MNQRISKAGIAVPPDQQNSTPDPASIFLIPVSIILESIIVTWLKICLSSLSLVMFISVGLVPPGSVFCVAIEPKEGMLAVTGGEDDTAFVWQTHNGNKLIECKGKIQVSR